MVKTGNFSVNFSHQMPDISRSKNDIQSLISGILIKHSMKFIVEINPAKEQEFLQLLQAWQSLDVVRAYGPTEETLAQQMEAEDRYLQNWKRHREKTTKELAEDYRDLVD